MDAVKKLMASLGISVLLGGTLTAQAEPLFQLAKVSAVPQRASGNIIKSRTVELTPAERQIGMVNLEEIMPIFERINREKRIYTSQQFDYFMRNFFYPNRGIFDLEKRKPPTQIVLHWTANSAPHIPLYTLSAFMRSRRGGRIQERPNRYKNVSNYFLTGTLKNQKGENEALLIKMTRGDLKRWGDIPRVTAYPTGENWDDNKYDGRGAVGIEIGANSFRQIYYNPLQREQLHNFIILVLKERGVLSEFAALRRSPYWDQMETLYQYLLKNLDKIDVNSRGGVPVRYHYLDKVIANLPQFPPELYGEISKMFRFISGHGVVAKEYINRMLKSGRPKDARYDRADFTEPHVFVIGMELLKSDLRYRGVGPDLETLRYIETQTKNQVLPGEEMQLPTSANRPNRHTTWYQFQRY